MNTIIRVNKANHSFVQIDRRVFEDPRMSWKAKGLLGYLLSRPDDWHVLAADLVKRSSDKRDSIYTALRELSEFGYAEFTQQRLPSGQMGASEWIVHESPRVSTAYGFSVSGETVSGSTVSGKPATTNNNGTDKDRTKKDRTGGNEASPPKPKQRGYCYKLGEGQYVNEYGRIYTPTPQARQFMDANYAGERGLKHWIEA